MNTHYKALSSLTSVILGLWRWRGAKVEICTGEKSDVKDFHFEWTEVVPGAISPS